MKLAEPDLVEKAFCYNVREATKELISQVKEMVYICFAHNGVGLAAPQVGIFKRFFIAFDQVEDNWRVFINPFYKSESEKFSTIEGCLTYPGQHYKVDRFKKVSAEWQEISKEGLVDQKQDLEGFFAQIFQHETDHTDGITIAMIGRKIIEPIANSFEQI